jgi:hypothetical protein
VYDQESEALKREVVVGNTGTAALKVTVQGPKHSPPFSIDNSAFMVDPHSSTVTVIFTPTRKGPEKDKLEITSGG